LGTQTTILVIDDNEPLLSYLCEYLELGGNRAVPATNGRSGVELFMQESPDIVLVDLKMPDMGGLDFITEIRKINDTVPVIVISGKGSLSDAVTANRVGAWDFLVKPFKEDELELAIARCLDRARLIRENRYYQEHLEQLVQDQTREILESRARYRTLLESVTDYIYTVIVKDSVPLKTIHRQGCEKITGYTPEEFYADPNLWYQIIHKDDRPLVYGLAQVMLTAPGNHTLEHRIIHKDGCIRWVSNTMVPHIPLFSDNEAVVGTVISYDGIILDITRRKNAEAQPKR